MSDLTRKYPGQCGGLDAEFYSRWNGQHWIYQTVKRGESVDSERWRPDALQADNDFLKRIEAEIEAEKAEPSKGLYFRPGVTHAYSIYDDHGRRVAMLGDPNGKPFPNTEANATLFCHATALRCIAQRLLSANRGIADPVMFIRVVTRIAEDARAILAEIGGEG